MLYTIGILIIISAVIINTVYMSLGTNFEKRLFAGINAIIQILILLVIAVLQ